jgi:hypothetical protein
LPFVGDKTAAIAVFFFQPVLRTILQNNEVPINVKAAAFEIRVKEIFTAKTKRRF